MKKVFQGKTVLAIATLVLCASSGIAYADTDDSTGVTKIQLAGNKLDKYPHFEYVKAFNENAPIQISIDSTKYPKIANETADVYVVEPLLFASNDRPLKDVRASGANRQIFANGVTTFELVTANELESKTYVHDTKDDTGLGHGYDIVLDMNQNGKLDSGDYVDGASVEEAGMYVMHDTTMPGPLEVAEVENLMDKNYAEAHGIPNGEFLKDPFFGTYFTEDDVDFYGEMMVRPDLRSQVIYYPKYIAENEMKKLPLIVISHGAGHNYKWYRHIGEHMASYGYIVMSHENGVEASIRSIILEHIDAFLDSLDTLADGILKGKVDTNRVILMGHSFGGKSVPEAYNTLLTGKYMEVGESDGAVDPNNSKTFTSKYLTAKSIILVDSIAPTAGSVARGTLPGNVNYHMWVGSADTDVHNDPNDYGLQSYTLYERAKGWRMVTTLQGVGHAWFHDGYEFRVIPARPATADHGEIPERTVELTFADGEPLLNRELTHDIQLGLLLPLIKYFAEGNVPATDYFWRDYSRFSPIGVDASDPAIVVSNEYRDNPKRIADMFMIDDFQTQPDLDISSSGATVSHSVVDLVEGKLKDNDGTFKYADSDPFNGAIQNDDDSDVRGAVFGWDYEDLFYKWEIDSKMQNFTNFAYISLRGSQVVGHPYNENVAELTFSITLTDATGADQSINIGAYGSSFHKPFDRKKRAIIGENGKPEDRVTAAFNEMKRIKIRLKDFTSGKSKLDLSKIVSVQIKVGPSHGTEKGSMIIDELMLTASDYKLTHTQDQQDFDGLFDEQTDVACDITEVKGDKTDPAEAFDFSDFGDILYE